MADLTRRSVRSTNNVPVDDQTTPDTSPEGNAKNVVRSFRSAKPVFADRRRCRIVFKLYIESGMFRHILPDPEPIQMGQIRRLHYRAGRIVDDGRKRKPKLLNGT